MRTLVTTIAWCTLVLMTVGLGWLHVEPDRLGKSQKISPEDKAASLVTKLQSPRYVTRVRASDELYKLGEAALPALRKAAQDSNDEEVRQRAHKLIAKIIQAASTSRSTKLKLVVVQSGKFTMGSPRGERGRQAEEQQHQVTITKKFLLGEKEVTQEQYQKVMKANPSAFAPTGESKQKVPQRNTDTFPVENVTWYDALDFCNRLSQLDGFPPYYKIENVERKGNSITKAKVTIAGGNGYRLPTEAEWEYACRAGTTTPYHYGRQTKQSHANLKAVQRRGAYGIRTGWKALGRTTVTGSYRPNAWKLHDMHGNVAEWCWDNYDAKYYAKSPAKDPQGPAESTHRVVRGGSWLVFEGSCRSASRFWMSPGQKKYSVGFRVARNPR